uniref:Uncharacterized protein MANES_17G047500 n=1 Tax=Rhizophora mucronata TaxID=61149 RepID=A0A2P2Q3F8_RHIMU
MSTSKAEEKRSLKEVEEEDEDEEDVTAAGIDFEDDDKNIKGRKGSTTGAGSMPRASCQADGCAVDMTIAKRYHRRHKVCELHASAPYVLVHGIRQRFCQQCSRSNPNLTTFLFCFFFSNLSLQFQHIS